MTKSEFRKGVAEGFFEGLRLYYDLIRAPFVICIAFIYREPSPLRRIRNEKPSRSSSHSHSHSQTPATND